MLEELQIYIDAIIRVLQKSFFPQEYQFFERKTKDSTIKKEFPSKSAILSLHPFMDERYIFRVGGRIKANEELTTQQKHQIIHPKCYFVKLIVRDMHLKFLHLRQLAMLSHIRDLYWPLGAKSTIRQVQHECLL